MRIRRCAGVVAVITLMAVTAAAQTKPAAVTVRTVPAVPVRGTLALVVVRARDSTSKVTAVDGEAAGEPLHFEHVGRSYRSIAGIPLEGPDSLDVTTSSDTPPPTRCSS